MKIKAKFKGADGSMGYRTGENYYLLFTAGFLHIGGRIKESILITPLTDGPQSCPYGSLKSFLNNWQVF